VPIPEPASIYHFQGAMSQEKISSNFIKFSPAKLFGIFGNLFGGNIPQSLA
jgi:hypothetical protein